MTIPTSIEQRWGKYRRLRVELAAAYAEPQWNLARLDRLTDEIAALEAALARQDPAGDARPARARSESAGVGPDR